MNGANITKDWCVHWQHCHSELYCFVQIMYIINIKIAKIKVRYYMKEKPMILLVLLGLIGSCVYT